MVERAAAGEAPSSPQPPEAGARRARLYGASPAAENRNRQTMPSSRCGASVRNAASGSASADFEHVVDLPLAAWRGLAARLRAFDLPRICERTAPRCLFSTMVACETCRSLSKVV